MIPDAKIDREYAAYEKERLAKIADACAINPIDVFRNTFAILHNLWHEDVPFLDEEERWRLFRQPIPTILRLDDTRLAALYTLVQSRQPARYKEVA